MKKRFVVVTGDSEGLGNAALHSLLRLNPHTQVIGLSRRPREQVDRIDRLTPSQAARYRHLRVDFSDGEQRAKVTADILSSIRESRGSLAALLLVNGTGYIDTDVEKSPELRELMETLNLTAPQELIEGLRPVLEREAPIFYFSGLVTHPNIHDPVLRIHGEIKKRAAALLRGQLGDRLKIMMPGAYRTDMLTKNIVRENALLEWFAIPLSDPYVPGGISDLVARHALRPHHRFPKAVIRPRMCHLLVTLNDAEGVIASLPGAIRRAARGVLAETGQTDAQHDARVRYFKEHQLYGESFPYDSILSDRLWPAWASKAYAASMRSARLLN